MVAIETDIQGYQEAKRIFERGVGILCGGFPCQDISVGGKRTGITGSRSKLWREMLRTIFLVRPRFAIVENVAALCKRGLGTVVGGMAEVGYDTEWHCIPASSVGALHKRDRIWVIGYPHRSDASNKGILSGDNFKEWQTEEGTQNWQHMLHELGAGDVAQRADTYAGALRVLDGIPNRSHRCKALGNSLVPKIPEIIGTAISEANKDKHETA